MASSYSNEISEIVGNTVDVTTPNKELGSKLTSLTDQLNTDEAKSLIPDGMTGESILGDNFRCRLKELGGKIEDLIEDGFGLGSILDSLKEPDLSKLGDALKKLSPSNLLKELGNLSVEGIAKGVVKIIDGAVGMITDIIEGTFNQIERTLKGIGGMFDEFGNRLKDIGGLVEKTIDGIVSGIGDVLSDLTKPIKDIIDTLTAPCPEGTKSAEASAIADLQSNEQLYSHDIATVEGNIVSVGEIGSVTGKVSRVAKQAAGDIAKENLAVSADTTGAVGTTGYTTSVKENQRREEQKTKAITQAKTEAAVTIVPPKPKAAPVTRVERVTVVRGHQNPESGEAKTDKDNVFSPPDGCKLFEANIMHFSRELDRAWQLLHTQSPWRAGQKGRNLSGISRKSFFETIILYNSTYYWYPFAYDYKSGSGNIMQWRSAREWEKQLIPFKDHEVCMLYGILFYNDNIVAYVDKWAACYKETTGSESDKYLHYKVKANNFLKWMSNKSRDIYVLPKKYSNSIVFPEVVDKIRSEDC